jgi:hypothetical protein
MMVLVPWRRDIGPIQQAKMVKTASMKLCKSQLRCSTLSATYLRRPKTFARVTGNIKTFGSKKYINASQIRPVRDAHETFFHLLDVISVQLTFDRGSVNIFSCSVLHTRD